MNPNRLLVLYAHGAPHRSRVNRRLADAARTVDGVYLHDLYETYPDFYIDVARERALVAQAEVLVFVHPFQWYGMPALLKEWVDLVLHDAWRHGPHGGPFHGKGYWLVTSTGSPGAEFAAGERHGRPFDHYLAPFEQSAAVCGMHWLAPHVLHGAHAIDAGALDAHVAAFVARLRQLAGTPAAARDHLKAPEDGT